MNYIKRLESSLASSERNLENGEAAIQDFRRFLQSDKFQGIDLDGGRKDWISTKDVEERLRIILDAFRGLTD